VHVYGKFALPVSLDPSNHPPNNPPHRPPPQTKQETTVFSTVHCPDQRYLLASSNQGRLAIWDLTSYLFPSASAASFSSAALDADEQYVDRPVLGPRGVKPFPRQLRPGQARLHPAALVQQGWPRLSLQVSDRAVNSVEFTPASASGAPTLVLAGDAGIAVYAWQDFLTLLQRDAPASEAVTVEFPAPMARLCALPAGAARAWPYLTESNRVALAGPREAYSAVRFSFSSLSFFLLFF
jgi:WD40 repeat protein